MPAPQRFDDRFQVIKSLNENGGDAGLISSVNYLKLFYQSAEEVRMLKFSLRYAQ